MNVTKVNSKGSLKCSARLSPKAGKGASVQSFTDTRRLAFHTRDPIPKDA